MLFCGLPSEPRRYRASAWREVERELKACREYLEAFAASVYGLPSTEPPIMARP